MDTPTSRRSRSVATSSSRSSPRPRMMPHLAELADRAADALGLLAVLPCGPAVRDRAIPAPARAHVAQDHEGRGRVFPALADVRATRLLADGVEVPLAHALLEAHVVRPAGRTHLEPRRLAPVAGALGLDDRE